MAKLSFGVAAYAGFVSSPDNESDFCWPPQNDTGDRGAGPLPTPILLRRRVGPIGQAALRAAWALPRVEHARFVFASRHGEFDRTLTMLEQVATEDGPSPADFSLGVHNALAGLLSVSTRNHGGHTALAAGIDSFGFGLMEAAVCLLERPDEPVVLVYYDAPLPQDYPNTVPACAETTLALALMLVQPCQAPRRVAMVATPIGGAEPGEAAAVAFLRFLRTSASQACATGERMRWDWHND